MRFVAKLTCSHNGKTRDITSETGNLTWSDSEDALGVEFSFDCKKGIYCGDIVTLKSGKTEIFRGIITAVGFSDGKTRQVKGHDFAWYLNKSECIVQFKKIAADKAIKQLCSRYNVPIGSIASMKTSIKKIYKDQLVYDVILDILKQVRKETGHGYRVEMRKGKLYVVKKGSIKIEPYYTDAAGRKVLSYKTCSINGERSIEEMKNEIIVAGSGEKAKQIKAVVKSSASIKKYGLLSQVETGEKLTEAKARNTGKNKLKQLNKIETSFTAEMLGGITVQASRLIYFNRPEASIKGWYKVRSCTHSFSGNIHSVSCEMEKV